MRRTIVASALCSAALCLPSAASGATPPISIRDSFRIGSAGTVLCTAQSMSTNAAIADMFDRGYAVTCRDAAVPVGQLFVLRVRDGDPRQRLSAARAGRVQCAAAPGSTQVEGLGGVETLECKLADADVAYRVFALRRGKYLYAAEGLAGYDSALKLGLRTLVADKDVPGELAIATTGVGDPAAFARVQAGTLDPVRAMAEAYRRNNVGSYAEAAEFFAVVRSGEQAVERAEGLANEAMQKSNLGRYGEADLLFGRAEELRGNDGIVARQLRNYRAMHLLNQGQPKPALVELDKPLPPGVAIPAAAITELVIDKETSARLNADSPVSRRLGMGAASLLPQEKAQLLDGQAEQLRGAALRLQGRREDAAAALARAEQQLLSVREGQLSSLVWMRSQILGELAAIAQESGNTAEADRNYLASIALLESDYPGSAVLLSARGRRAGFLAQTGRTEEAATIFREIVRAQAEGVASTPGLARVLSPYVDLLLKKGSDQQAMSDLFEASQVLVRPGIAQTQAVLARELSAGSDEAARLFRQAVSLTRQVERARIELSRLQALGNPSAVEATRIRTLQASIEERQKDQVATQAKLAEFPRFRAVSTAAITLDDLKAQLRPGEAYYKLAQVGDHLIAMFVTSSGAKAFRLAATSKELDQQVNSLRETISTVENGQHMTYPFDAALAHQLYQTLFGPVHGDMAAVRHLIFEPDGAMLRLPPNLLITEAAGVEAYRARAARGGDAEFDFTGIQWLGRDRDVSTSVSARAFRDVREAPRSAAGREYLGLGENSVPSGTAQGAGGVRGIEAECALSLTAWNRPISPQELQLAQSILGGGDPVRAEVVTRESFTDTAIKQRTDLTDYRIIHFATHGIVTSPRARCPAQPALMTSFGGDGSDGLLTFREIFDLRLDADLVILSACDTAGTASTLATQEAGLGTGGDVALDGLVRAFVGAGGRIVVASHWPVPDDFNATQRLISGLFTAQPGTSVAGALRQAQRGLMDDPATSHPFYWSGFATIGDGSTPVRRPTTQQVASR
jgi:CHAT domain-containing protein